MATRRRVRRRERGAGRNDQVVRVLQLLHELDRLGGCDLYELAERHGTTTRTIRRDFEALEAAGVPLRREPGEGARVRWSLDGAATQRLTQLVETSHFLALRLAMADGTVARHTGSLAAALDDLAERIEKALGPGGRAQLLEIDRCFFSWDKFAWQKAPPDLVWPLVRAISEERVCRVRYRAPSSGNKERSFPVRPLRLFVHQGALYVHAWQPKFRQVLLLNVHRLAGLQLTEERLATPPEYDAAALEATAFGIFIGPEAQDFVLRFDAFARPYIEERRWHPSQRLRARPDGGVELRFRCVPSYEVTNWVASWREHCEVLEPAALREELAQYGQWLRRCYAPREERRR